MDARLFTCLVLSLFNVGHVSVADMQVGDNPADRQTFTLGKGIKLQVDNRGIVINIHSNHTLLLHGILGRDLNMKDALVCQDIEWSSNIDFCVQWERGPRLEIYKSNLENDKRAYNMQCITVNWTQAADADSLSDTPENCFSMDEYFWFGGFEEPSQKWPINDFEIAYTPFITGLGNQNQDFGDVLEGLFLSSSGTGIVVNETTPLYLSVNNAGSKRLCLKGKVGANTPFFQIDKAFLRYDICQSTDITTLWKGIADKYIPKPQNYPSTAVLRYPIWTTWAEFKQKINQSTVLGFAKEIKNYNFSISQLEIDDNWTPHYGDFIFNKAKFPNASEMIAELTQMGIPTTVWVHWFFNNDSDAFSESASAGFLIKEIDSERPLLVSWWDGKYAGVLDFTNPDAVKWYLGKLSDLKINFNVSSFKFDAGGVVWVKDKKYKVKGELLHPNYLSTRYAEATYQADPIERRQELRVGYRSQASALMVRVLDRSSDWSHQGGIKTLIPSALVFGFMGYPYILPDMIGGNAYGSGSSAFPDYELFIRWLQASVFLPVLQFSIEPWTYKNDTVTEICRKFVELHERYADKIIDLAKNAQQTGEPIIRPLWWIAPSDKDALTTDSEFLLGNDLLVAPVLDQGARSRDIYLPAGQWKDELRGVTRQGGTWLRNYQANLDELPYFTKI